MTTSLECALRHLRDERRVLRLWADGICISQADDEEKAKQVEQMGKIYQCAHHTVIFLGKCDEAAESVVFEALQHCKEEAPKIEEGLPERAFKQLFWRPWFYRVWALQELVLSRDQWVQLGTIRFSWSRLCEFARFMKRKVLPQTLSAISSREEESDATQKKFTVTQ